MADYAAYLDDMERGYYDANDNLLVDKLAGRPDLEWVRYHMQ